MTTLKNLFSFCLIVVIGFIFLSCTKTGSFNVTDIETNDKSISQEELNNYLSHIIGKEIKINKYGDNLKLQLEDEPDVYVFKYDSSHNGIVNYKASTNWGEFTLQYNVALDVLSDISVIDGKIITYNNGNYMTIKFK